MLTDNATNSDFITAYTEHKKTINNRVNSWVKSGDLKQLKKGESVSGRGATFKITKAQKSAGSKKKSNGKMSQGDGNVANRKDQTRTVRLQDDKAVQQTPPPHQGSQGEKTTTSSSSLSARGQWLEQAERLIISSEKIEDLTIADVQNVINQLSAVIKKEQAATAKLAKQATSKKAA